MTDHEILALVCAAEREAAALMLEARQVLAETKSGRRDVVTAYDRQVQELLIARLSEKLPEARFYCEENDRHDDLHADCVFIIDPIDGTMNFVHGLHHSCISVACMRGGVLRVAAVCNPYSDELFTAVRGEGAFLNGRPIHASSDSLADSLVACGTAPYDTGATDRTFALIRLAYRSSLDIRREGAAALDLCAVAAGRYGLFFELGLSLWDYAAGMLLVEEAGGVCCTVEGGELPLDGGKPTVLAGGKGAAAEFLALSKGL